MAFDTRKFNAELRRLGYGPIGGYKVTHIWPDYPMRYGLYVSLEIPRDKTLRVIDFGLVVDDRPLVDLRIVQNWFLSNGRPIARSNNPDWYEPHEADKAITDLREKIHPWMQRFRDENYLMEYLVMVYKDGTPLDERQLDHAVDLDHPLYRSEIMHDRRPQQGTIASAYNIARVAELTGRNEIACHWYQFLVDRDLSSDARPGIWDKDVQHQVMLARLKKLTAE